MAEGHRGIFIFVCVPAWQQCQRSNAPDRADLRILGRSGSEDPGQRRASSVPSNSTDRGAFDDR